MWLHKCMNYNLSERCNNRETFRIGTPSRVMRLLGRRNTKLGRAGWLTKTMEERKGGAENRDGQLRMRREPSKRRAELTKRWKKREKRRRQQSKRSE